jgi:small subunit ribosomal protein S14
MKHLLEKDKKRRKLVNNYELKRFALKSILMNCNLPVTFRWKAGLKLSELPKDSSKVRLRNRCVLTNRSRGNLGVFKISRIELRRLASSGQINGLKKSSW